MKNLTVWLVLAFTSFTLQAQPEVNWGPRLREGRSISIISVPGILDGNVFVFKNQGALFARAKIMQKLNSEMAPVRQEKLDLDASGKDLFDAFCLQFDGALYLLASWRDDDRKCLFADEIDLETLQLKGQGRTIAEIPVLKRSDPGQFRPVYSRDSTHLLIIADVNAKNKDDERYDLFVYGPGLELEWKKEVTLDIQEKFFAVQDYVVDNEGNVYLTGTSRDPGRINMRDDIPDFHYQVMAYRDQGRDVEEYDVSLSTKFISDLLLTIGPDGNLICAGFYSEEGKGNIKGSYYLVIDKDSRELVSESTKEFELDFITMNYTEAAERRAERRDAKGKNVELYKYQLDDIIPRADGGAVLTAEQYYTRVYYTTTPATGTAPARTEMHTLYLYNDIIVVSIDPDGEIEWATKIPKRQRSIDDHGYYSSYALMITGRALHFVFNDNKRNLEIEKQGKIQNFNVSDKKGIVMLATVDTEGNVERRPLFSNREVETITRPKFCLQISPTEMLLFGQRGRSNQFGRVDFGE